MLWKSLFGRSAITLALQQHPTKKSKRSSFPTFQFHQPMLNLFLCLVCWPKLLTPLLRPSVIKKRPWGNPLIACPRSSPIICNPSLQAELSPDLLAVWVQSSCEIAAVTYGRPLCTPSMIGNYLTYTECDECARMELEHTTYIEKSSKYGKRKILIKNYMKASWVTFCCNWQNSTPLGPHWLRYANQKKVWIKELRKVDKTT